MSVICTETSGEYASLRTHAQLFMWQSESEAAKLCITCTSRAEHWDASSMAGSQQRHFGVDVVDCIQDKVRIACQQLVFSCFCIHGVDGFHICFGQDTVKMVLQQLSHTS